MKKIILGNWKQQGSADLLDKTYEIFAPIALPSTVEVGILPPAIFITQAKTIFENTAIRIGTQNISATKDGAFTGEISARMCLESGCDYALVGHSERRQYFHETNEIVAQKFEQAARAGLIPVVCIGETSEEYDHGKTHVILKNQIDAVSIHFNLPNRFIIAYEPVWAIGTGKAATKEYAQETHAFIRSILPPVYQNTAILYGGSVKPDNVSEYLCMPDIHGVLVGGASLIPESFRELVQKTEKIHA